MTEPTSTSRLVGALGRPVDIAWLAAFRVLFFGLMCVGSLRFLASDWVRVLYVEPQFHFKYWGLSWVAVPPEAGVYALFSLLAFCALLAALGLFYRGSSALFTALFAYAQLLDVTNYLNHYYLVALLSLLLSVLPAHRAWSLDVHRDPALGCAQVPAWTLYLLRLQVAVVYFYAGLAKFSGDWLLHAQPLNIWLTARTDMPVLGALFEMPWIAHAMAWAGFLYDTTIPLWLSLRRTRPYAYVVVILFHTLTKLLFDIGLFPFIMTLSALVFFSPSWPRTLASWCSLSLPATRSGDVAGAAPGRAGLALLTAYCAMQVLLPLRSFAYDGDVLWHEQGMRLSWRVMVREKHGAVTYHVHDPRSGRDFQVSPGRYLTRRQEGEFSSQPDLILQLGHHVAADFARRGMPDVSVRAEALVSLNGRALRHLVDPEVDLRTVRDGLGEAPWILPGPQAPPLSLRPPMYVHRN